MREILTACKEGALAKEGVLPSLIQVADGHEFSRTSLSPCSGVELAAEIRRAQQELSGIKVRRPEQVHNILMGILMKRVRGKVDGKTLSNMIRNMNVGEPR